MLSEIIRQAEARLQHQADSAGTIDQRAMAFAAVCGAFAGIALARAAEAWSRSPALGWAGLGAGGVILIAMFASILAARPSQFYVPGNEPSNWLPDIEQQRSLHSALCDTAASYDHQIKENNRRLRARTRLLNAALWCFFLAPFAAGAAFVLAKGAGG